MITCRILPRVLSNIHVITIQGGGIFFFWGEVWVVALGVRVSYHVPMMILMLMLMLMLMMMMMMMMMVNVADPCCDSGQTLVWNRKSTTSNVGTLHPL